MPDPHPPLEGIVSAIHAVLAEPGVRSRLTGEGGHVIEFTETALVAFVAGQRAAAWEAALATTAPAGEDAGDREFASVASTVEQAVVDLLREGPRSRGEIDQAVMDQAGCARATVSRALDSLTRRGTVAPLPRRKGWRLVTASPTIGLLARARNAITSNGDTRMHTKALAQALGMPVAPMQEELRAAGVGPLRRAFTRGGEEARGYDLADIDAAIAAHAETA
ncbi:hypothetical protein [Nocardiopsis sp. NPDC057823]|uniref:hypothetical protein n=1 Tax=Nocardiopsis sp. NPDC057823 TaxID=3346256 RepID=UPI003672D484